MNIKRQRGRGYRPGPGGSGGGGGAPMRHQGGNVPLNRNHVFDSSGPDMRMRGTAQQLFEKYLQMGRDATSGGDRVMAEGYFQHAEHYFRIINAMNQAVQQTQPNGQQNGQPQQQPRRQYNGEEIVSATDDAEDGTEAEQPPGTGEQPTSRDIPIAAAPPEG
ncbi:MAG: DUF4167 domain-containing protein [Acetobacteraceae bacterium]